MAMNLTQAIIVFIVVAIVVISAFCFTAWYFDRKNRYKYESAFNDEIDPELVLSTQPNENGHVKNEEKSIEMQLLSKNPVNMAKMSERAAAVQTNRLSVLSGMPPTFNRPSTIRNNMDQDQENKTKTDIIYTYISKLARYTREGIQLYDRDVKSVRVTKVFRQLNWVDEVKEKSDVAKTFVAADAPNFQDMIDVLRFQECDYDKGVKWLIDIKIKGADYDKDYKVADIPKNEYFQFITEAEYAQQVNKLSEI